jgi:RNA polymerase sigma factor (sigma-70 family)
MSTQTDNRPTHEKVDPYKADAEAHQALVKNMLKRFANGHPVSVDMLSDANYGTALACLKYDSERLFNGKRVRFITFLYHCVIHELVKGRKARQNFIPIRKGHSLLQIDSENSPDVADQRFEKATEIESDIIEKLRWAVDHLEDRDREIIRLRLAGETLEQVGERLNLTRERVRQLQDRAHRQLHRYLYDMGVKNV